MSATSAPPERVERGLVEALSKEISERLDGCLTDGQDLLVDGRGSSQTHSLWRVPDGVSETLTASARTSISLIGVGEDTPLAERAREAITIVCSGDLGRVDEYYDERFVDHVNGMTFHGLEGAKESVGFYRQLFPDLRFEIEDQVTDGDRVASRFAMHGTYRARNVTMRGIVISRFEEGKIVEDWGYTDSLSLARQLGLRGLVGLTADLLTRRVRLPAGALGSAAPR